LVISADIFISWLRKVLKAAVMLLSPDAVSFGSYKISGNCLFYNEEGSMKKISVLRAGMGIAFLMLMFTACPSPGGGELPPGTAIGWIGGGSNGWQTGDAPASGADYHRFNNTWGVAVDGSGNIYVAEANNHRISKWNRAGNAVGWIGGGTNGWQTGNAPASGADYQSFNQPYSVYVDGSGNIYVADTNNHRISKWDKNGDAIGWIGGGSDDWQTGDVPASGADFKSFNSPTDVCVDGSGNIYVADTNNHRISKWDKDGAAIAWIGGGLNGWQTGNAPVAGSDYRSFANPHSVCVNGSGNIYIADSNHRISKWKN
jgi:hypothetical protein